MLVIRLRRIGKKQRATFRFIISEKTRSPQSTALEFLGSYDPHTNPATVKVNADRMKHWIKQGAQLSDTVNNLLINAGVITGSKVKTGSAKKSATPEPAVEAPKEGKKEEAPVAA